jgi:hypothetical protein
MTRIALIDGSDPISWSGATLDLLNLIENSEHATSTTSNTPNAPSPLTSPLDVYPLHPSSSGINSTVSIKLLLEQSPTVLPAGSDKPGGQTVHSTALGPEHFLQEEPHNSQVSTFIKNPS